MNARGLGKRRAWSGYPTLGTVQFRDVGLALLYWNYLNYATNFLHDAEPQFRCQYSLSLSRKPFLLLNQGFFLTRVGLINFSIFIKAFDSSINKASEVQPVWPNFSLIHSAHTGSSKPPLPAPYQIRTDASFTEDKLAGTWNFSPPSSTEGQESA